MLDKSYCHLGESIAIPNYVRGMPLLCLFKKQEEKEFFENTLFYC